MKSILTALAALSVMAVGATAHADDDRYRSGAEAIYGAPHGWRDHDDHADLRYRPDHNFNPAALNRLRWRIDTGVEDGSITRSEARRLYTQLNDLAHRQSYYWRTGGLNGWERNDLARRYDHLRYAIREARTNEFYAFNHGGYRRY